MTHRLVLTAALAALAASAGLAPAAAQPVEEMVVLGHGPKAADTFSYKITYRDLDLRTPAGEKELRRRVSVTATYVCNKLGEKGPKSTCRRQAISDADPTVRAVIDVSHLQKAKWTPGPGWTPPPGYK